MLQRLADDGGAGPVALTPMIDVVFLLMIFFLFGTIPLGERQILAAIARASTAPAASSGAGPCWVAIRPGEAGGVAYRVDGGAWLTSLTDVEVDLAAALARPDRDGRVTVDAQPGVSFQRVVDVFTVAQRLGATGVSMRAD